MSKNILQVYQDNPIVTNQSNDLMYFGRSPYGLGDDTAMRYADFISQLNLIPTIAGTANQVFVNGGTAPVSGTPITLSLPQDIATTSSPTFNSLTLSNSGSLTNTNFVSAGFPNNPFLFGSTSTMQTKGVPGVYLQVGRGGATGFLDVGCYTNNTLCGVMTLFKSRSTTIGTRGAVQSGDFLGQLIFSGDDGANFISSALITVRAQGTISAVNVPCTITIQQMITGGSLVDALKLNVDGSTSLYLPLPVGSGGLGITTTPSNGQIPIGNGTTYSAATLTAGTGVSITNGSGSVTIAATGGGLAVATIAGTTQSAAVNTKYFALNASQTTVTLPSTYAVGTIVALVGSTANTGGWVVTAAAGDTIRVNNVTTSAGGSVTSAAVAGQTIYLECDVANASWVMTSTVSTTLTTS